MNKSIPMAHKDRLALIAGHLVGVSILFLG